MSNILAPAFNEAGLLIPADASVSNLSGSLSNLSDSLQGKGLWRVEKFEDTAHHDAFLRGDASPYEIFEAENVWLLTGLNELFRLIVGASTNRFTESNTQIGVGDASTAAANSQTDLQAASNKTYVVLDTGTLTYGANGGTNNTLVTKATFGTSSANYAWQEMVVKQSVSGVCWNRAVQNLGTKATGTVWIAQCTLSLT